MEDRIERIKYNVYAKAERKIRKETTNLLFLEGNSFDEYKYLLSVVEDLIKDGDEIKNIYNKLVLAAIIHDNLELYKYVMDNKSTIMNITTRLDAGIFCAGVTKIPLYILNTTSFTPEEWTRIIRHSISSNKYPIVQFVVNEHPEVINRDIVMHAFECGKLEYVKLVRSVYPWFFPALYDYFDTSAGSEYYEPTELLTYLLDEGLRPDYRNPSLYRKREKCENAFRKVYEIEGTNLKYTISESSVVRIMTSDDVEILRFTLKVSDDGNIVISILGGRDEILDDLFNPQDSINQIVDKYLEIVGDPENKITPIPDYILSRLNNPPTLLQISKNAMGINKVEGRGLFFDQPNV